MRRRRLAGVVLIAILLSGCASDGEGSPAGEATGEPAPEPAETAREDGTADSALAEALDCLQGEWSENMVNLLDQWQSWSPSGQGLPVTAVDGQNTLTVTESSMTYTVDSLVATESPESRGIAMTGEAVTSGSASFDYEVHGPTTMTVGPVTEQSVTSVTRVYIDGSLSSETPIPWDGGIEGAAIWWCEGDTLSLEPSVSGWIHLFTRI